MGAISAIIKEGIKHFGRNADDVVATLKTEEPEESEEPEIRTNEPKRKSSQRYIEPKKVVTRSRSVANALRAAKMAGAPRYIENPTIFRTPRTPKVADERIRHLPKLEFSSDLDEGDYGFFDRKGLSDFIESSRVPSGSLNVKVLRETLSDSYDEETVNMVLLDVYDAGIQKALKQGMTKAKLTAELDKAGIVYDHANTRWSEDDTEWRESTFEHQYDAAAHFDEKLAEYREAKADPKLRSHIIDQIYLPLLATIKKSRTRQRGYRLMGKGSARLQQEYKRDAEYKEANEISDQIPNN